VAPRRAAAVAEGGDLREHLLSTTERLLEERSATALTTRQIAREAGVSDGVLYNYFSGREELVLAALVRRFVGLLERFHAELPEPGTGTLEQNLRSFALASLELHVEALPLIASLLAEPALLRRFMVEIHREPLGPRQLLGPVSAYLDAERAEGRVAGVDVHAAADLLVGAIVMRAFTTLIGAGRSDVAERLPALVETLVRGLAPRT
jgi:AcrR family transcriptional regulator